MSKRLAAAAAAITVAAMLPAALATTASSAASVRSGTKLTVHKVATAHLTRTGLVGTELRDGVAEDATTALKAVANRSPKSHAKALRTVPTPSGITPTQVLGVTGGATGFQGLNHRDQRLADGGNQFSTSPPDQMLCAGNSQLVEGVNTAVRVFGTNGAPLTAALSLNEMLWGDHEYNRTTGVQSVHQMGDPSCVYDAASNRFFMTVYDLETLPDGTLTGRSFVDIAVSPAGTGVGSWAVYQLDTSNDGKLGTPEHPSCPCFGDYPHLGTDANGLFITTNEYSTLGNGYNGAIVYAIAKSALVSNSATIPGAMFGTKSADLYQGVYYDGFTLAPAVSAGTSYAPNTMYFLSSDSWSGDIPIVSKQVLVWKIANTSALATDPTSLRLDMAPVKVDAYYPPPNSTQKAGPIPLADCLNTTACAKLVLGRPDKYKEYEETFDSSDTRMLQSAYADGKLWGALGTAVDIDGTTRAGVAYYVINPATSTVVKQGTLAVSGGNITYPALAATTTGKGVMALSLSGTSWFPSAAYVKVDDVVGHNASGVTVVGAGMAPYDDFTGYRGFLYNRPRFGDYGAAAVVGSDVWIASEYIAASCTYAEYVAAPFGSCGGTRTSLANWSTHIASVPAG